LSISAEREEETLPQEPRNKNYTIDKKKTPFRVVDDKEMIFSYSLE